MKCSKCGQTLEEWESGLCEGCGAMTEDSPGKPGEFYFLKFLRTALAISDNEIIIRKSDTHNTTQHTQGDRTMRTISLGNNEAVSSGITVNSDGTFTAMTFTTSKTFKTLKSAQKWLAIRLSK